MLAVDELAELLWNLMTKSTTDYTVGTWLLQHDSENKKKISY
jgi:hypothetical protein